MTFLTGSLHRRAYLSTAYVSIQESLTRSSCQADVI